MKGRLDQAKLDYVFYHFALGRALLPGWEDGFAFVEGTGSAQVHFPQSDRPLDRGEVPRIDGLPVLFPTSDRKEFYTIQQGKLTFHHDLLKSAFYLLSGYQEIEDPSRDRLGRFPYANSVQAELGIATKPLVNYYFEIIEEGLRALRPECFGPRSKLFDPFAFLLSHDIDKIRKYDWDYFKGSLKQMAGLLPRQRSMMRQGYLTLQALAGIAGVVPDRNPYWTFRYIAEQNRLHKLRSTYFFLPRDVRFADGNYDLDDPALVALYAELGKQGDEIAVHGTVRSSHSVEESKRNTELIEAAAGSGCSGIRQHRLSYDLPKTAAVHEQVGYRYDASLGFAEHEGFRNGFCLPFRLFDFKANRMRSVWQIPLNVMDVTLTAYRKLDFHGALQAVEAVTAEVAKFGGAMSLLVHNTFLDESLHPGVREFYERLLDHISAQRPIACTASDLIDALDKKSAS